MSNDFHSEHNTAEAFLGEIYARQLVSIIVDGEHMCCVSNMTEREVREAIVDDVLAVTMWETQNPDKPISLDFQEMLRFVHEDYRSLVETQLNHPEIAGLMTVVDGQYRIVKEHAVLKAVMDYAGVWYDGFTPPDDIEIIGINREKFDEMIKTHGSIENLAKNISAQVDMDLTANSPTTTTLQ